MKFFQLLLKMLSFIIFSLIHKKECVHFSKHCNKINIHESTTQTKNQNIQLYFLNLPVSSLPLALICLFHSSKYYTEFSLQHSFPFFLSDFDPLFQYANFLSYSVSLTPSSICCEILGIVENIKAHLVIYHFSFIYYHNVLYFMFNPCTFVFNATEHNHLLPLHTDVIY